MKIKSLKDLIDNSNKNYGSSYSEALRETINLFIFKNGIDTRIITIFYEMVASDCGEKCEDIPNDGGLFIPPGCASDGGPYYYTPGVPEGETCPTDDWDDMNKQCDPNDPDWGVPPPGRLVGPSAFGVKEEDCPPGKLC